MRYKILFFIVYCVALDAEHAQAEGCAYPCFSYNLTSEVQADWAISIDPGDDRNYDFGPTSTLEAIFKPAENAIIVSDITTESVLDNDFDVSRAFRDAGTYLGAAYAEVTLDSMTLRAGKFDPEFSLASDVLDGFHATDLADNLDTEERIGIRTALEFETFSLKHNLVASAFTTDRTIFSDSLFTSRGQLHLSDGGAGNAKGLASLALLLDGCKGADPENCFTDGAFGYRFGMRYQKSDSPTKEQIDDGVVPRNEYAFLSSVISRHYLGDDMALRLLGEAAYVRHLDGGADDAAIVTLSAGIEVEPLTWEATYSLRRNLVSAGSNSTDHLVDISMTYDFDEDTSIAGESWSLGAGYSYAKSEADKESSHILTLLLSLELDGTFDLR